MRAHLKSHPDVVAHCAGLVDVLDINNATVALLEVATKGEILGSLGKLLKDATGDVFREEICSLYDGKEGFVSAMVGRSLKGNPIDCVVRGTVAPGYERSWSRVLVSVTDVTERKRAEKRLQANQYYLTKAQEIGMIGTWELDVQENILIWTDENYRIFGVPLGTELNYELFLNCVHPDDRDYVHESWSAGLDHMPYDIEHRIMVADEVKWVREKADVEFDSEGNPTVAIGVTQDITARKQAERALRESEERFRGYVETSQDLIWESDAEGIITYLNPAWEKVTGYRASELLGKSYFDLLAEEEVERERAQFAEHPEGIVNGHPTTYITKTGSEILLIFNTIPLYDASKNIIGTLGSAYDVTDRVRAEEAQRESNQRLEETLAALRDTQEQMMHQERLAAVGQLSAGIAHDFNNILASIVLYTQMSLGTNELSATTRQRLEVIARETDRAAELVQQMLDFGRQAVLRREALNLQPLLEKTVALLERTLPENVRLDLVLELGETIIDADPARVQQAIVNLALNARDAMPDGGELHVALSRVEDGEFDCVDCGRVVGGDWVQVTVRDTGRGIAPDVLPHIFEPFFTTRAPLGHGLGLAQVYGIVVQHGGHIEVETAVGLGTTFRLLWPATSVAQLEAPVQVHPDTAQGKGQTVLVVEDNAMMRTALLDVMDMLGYRVLEAANGREALVVCEQHKDDISLVLSDWVMPQMGGLALVRELERRDVAVKVLMLTGHPLDNETKMAVPTSVVGWLLKPVDLDQLTEAVAQALAGAGA